MFLLKILRKYFTYWGIQFEGEMYPEFIITEHARKRVEERFGCNKEKTKEIVLKAWYKGKKAEICYIHNHEQYKSKVYTNYVYKDYQGFIFIFARRFKSKNYAQKVLITAFKRVKWINDT